MSDVVIKAENLGKKYTIGHQAGHDNYLALRDVLMQNARGIWTKTRDLALGKPIIQGSTLEEIWALRDVSFEIRRGEAVGIIGRNGAGKSTLLKILSRITEPSAGRVTIKGRVASLLEVGTGFHPELTGRENVYLNGAILGMTRAEIKRKFDEIVAFAEIEKFLDTPVKRYSSGMYVRLAFAVAAHLEPEILLVDEVLAVGDLPFQKKCLGKMSDVAGQGRTVLFVSHNMAAVQRLCKRAVRVSQGQITEQGDVKSVTEHYIAEGRTAASGIYDLRNLALPTWQRRIRGDLRFDKCVIMNARGEPSARLHVGEPITVHLEIRSPIAYDDLDVGFGIDSVDEIRITTVRNTDLGLPVSIAASQPLRLNVAIQDLILLPGGYYLSLFVHSGRFASDVILRVLSFEVDELAYGEQVLPSKREGLVGARAIWNMPGQACDA